MTRETKIRAWQIAMTLIAVVITWVVSSFLDAPGANRTQGTQNEKNIAVIDKAVGEHERRITATEKDVLWLRERVVTKEDLNAAKDDIKELIRSINRDNP